MSSRILSNINEFSFHNEIQLIGLNICMCMRIRMYVFVYLCLYLYVCMYIDDPEIKTS